MARHDHHWGFASEVGQCRRGKACEASPINREGYPPKLTAEAMRRQANGPLSPTALVCSACGLCADDAPESCTPRRRAA